MNIILTLMMGLLASLLGGCSSDSKFETVDVETFHKAITTEEVQLLDVRTPLEFAEVHIEGAVNVDIYDSEFVQNVEKSMDKGKKLYIYCRSGARSQQAASILAREGYDLVNLDGGIIAWNASGKPLVSEQ